MIKNQSSQYDLHKDELPEKSIEKIENILDSIGFKKENKTIIWFEPFANCHSCLLSFSNYPLKKSGGKGISKSHSLASAYGEFMERLQCFLNSYIFYSHCGLKSKNPYISEITYDAINPDLYKKVFSYVDIKNFSHLKNDTFLSYYDVFNKKFEYLPYNFLRTIVRSTGMSAGNTMAEAVCQAINEVMERYALHFAKNNPNHHFPTININDLNLKSDALKKLIKTIEKDENRITIKDCTLEGKIPVLAVIIEDLKNNNYDISFGSDPVFEVTLQRCITEAYQCKTKLKNSIPREKLKNLKHFDLSNEEFILIDTLLQSKNSPKYPNAFVSSDLSHSEFLNFLLKKIKEMNFDVYIRDFSYLGFPSYHVFIPGMSYGHRNIKENLNFNKKIIWDLINNLEKTSKDEISKVCNEIYHNINKIEYSLSSSFSLGHGHKPLHNMIDFKFLAPFLFLECNKYSKLKDVLENLFERDILLNNKEPLEFKKILSYFCSLKESNKNDLEIIHELENIFPTSSYKNSLIHLVNKNYASFYNKQDKNAIGNKFSDLEIPQCTDIVNCISCKCEKKCYFDELLKLQTSIKKHIKNVDQNILKEQIETNNYKF